MGGARETPEASAARRDDALAEGRRRAGSSRGGAMGPPGLLALQRAAGNAAVSALMAARFRSPGAEAVADINAALTEFRSDEPVVETVDKGLAAAKAAGVPVVEDEGPKPPPSALAVTTTGFGPGSVPAKKPVPPPKPVPAVSPLGKAAAKRVKPPGGGRGAARGGGAAPAGAAAGVAAGPAAPGGLAADQVLAPPVPPARARPEGDSAFTRVTGAVKKVAKAKRAHPPAASKAKEAQDAALAPADDLAGQAKAAKADTMDAQQPGAFDKKAFIAAVKTAIEAKSPKTLKEADNYKKSGKAGEVKNEVKGLVTSGTEGQARDIEKATEAPPDQSKAVPKPVTPMGPEEPGQAVAIPAAGAVPKPAPPEQLNLAAGTHEANKEMAEGEVTETQLAESNEPQFTEALADKKAAAAHAASAPGEFRKEEQQVIAAGKADAGAHTAAGVAGMQSAKGAALAKLVADKGKAKTKDEAKRAEVTTKIQGIFAAAEADVTKILDGIDPKVDAEFTRGEAAARQTFETYVAEKMSAYKEDRYSGWRGKLRWIRDKFKGMPDKVNEFYVAGRELYLTQMNKTIARVADIVGDDLTAAKRRIATGRAEIATYVKSLPKDLKKVGAEASKDIGERFAQLESDVDAKQESVVDTLATKYTEARKGLDDRIEELQAENKGLIDKAIGAIKAIINTIRELASMLKNVLSRVAGVVGDIISSPVKFLGNLIDGVKGGILKFKDNIVEHLRKGLMTWLFGALAEGDVELPDKFDPQGIITLLASLFGLTWTNIRNRLVKQIGEKAMAAVETGVEIFSMLKNQGVGGLWQMLLAKLGNIKEMILEQVKDFVVTKIITAGITWLISLLNPAAAFIKACKLIYDVVMFFVNNAERIMKFVNTVIDSVADVVRGNISGVIDKINDALGQMVPILIGFLASVLNLSGIGQKIREIVGKLQKPVNQALDFVIKTGLKLAGPIIRGIKGISGKVKAKVAAGKAYVKGKVEAGKKYVKEKVRKVGEALGIIRKPFTAGKARHTLSVDLKTGAIRMASSREAPIRQAIEYEIAAVNERRRAAGKDPLPRDQILTNVLPQIAQAQQQISAAGSEKKNRTRVAQTQLDQLSVAVVNLLSTIGGDVEEADEGTAPPQLGRVARHGENSGAVPRDARRPWFDLESEHVISVRLVSALFHTLGDTTPIARPGPEDDFQRTILVYKGAADRKTHGHPDEDGKVGLADSDAIGHVKSILSKGAPNIGDKSRSRVARGHRALEEAERREREEAWKEVPPDDLDRVAEVLRAQLPDRMTERVDDLVTAIDADHAELGQRRRQTEAAPDAGKVRAAAMLQVHDIVEIFLKRMRRR